MFFSNFSSCFNIEDPQGINDSKILNQDFNFKLDKIVVSSFGDV
jgi:hypothetical protein